MQCSKIMIEHYPKKRPEYTTSIAGMGKVSRYSLPVIPGDLL